MWSPALPLPRRFVAWLEPYLGAFSRRSRATAAALAVGALLAIGPCTVTNCLRALGLTEDGNTVERPLVIGDGEG